MIERSKNTLSFLALVATLLVPGLFPRHVHGMYDPKHGRWLQRDPIGYVDGQNLYQSARSAPTNHVDPYGTKVQADCDAQKLIDEAGICNYRISGPATRTSDGRALVIYEGKNAYMDQEYWGDPVRREIILRMIQVEGHTFRVKDGKVAEWERHIASRLTTISVARRVQFRYRDDNNITGLSSEDWDGRSGMRVLPGRSAYAAVHTTLLSPGVQMGCAAGRIMVFMVAVSEALGQEAFDGLVEQTGGRVLIVSRTFFRGRPADSESDWVPGDSGGMPNPRMMSGVPNDPPIPPGFEGFNLIYMGSGQFWSHGTGEYRLSEYKAKLRAGDPDIGALPIAVEGFRNYLGIGVDE